MSETPFVWAGVLTMLMVAVFLIAVTWPVIGEWRDDWRQYAAGTALGGPCAEDPTLPQCDDQDRTLEKWELVPWIMTIGLAAGLLALCFPAGRDLRPGGGWPSLSRARDFLRSQR